MRFVNYRHDGEVRAGRVEGDAVVPLAIPPISAGFDLALLLEAPAAAEAAPLPLADVRLLAPVLQPGKVICLGLNYRGHVTETKRELPTYPVLFTKFAESIIGPADDIVAPPESTQIDYEAELAVVIGRPARRISLAEAPGVVAGYAVANDVTMRDYQYKTHQWLQGKAWPRTTPLGPWLVTADELGAEPELDIALELNGQERQRSNTRHMIFGLAETISTLSEFMTLAPGDVVLTGTPAGVGYRRDPQVFLTPGDRVKVTIEGIGSVDNTVVAEDVHA
ncbi:Ureidoglycolate lyase [Baekduia alba]|uniref:fumarylacetoacetate hydrolase family protein n=1 Tax=Baekduia alba TaxID=2997333 RepID=UPI002341A004|nr:fumarylacetoacetate hydrolase family protein [Baekduia alba]WCB91789.1 Ureidoglycolate lyase [Baekduia alba]